ncbi:NAD(P)H-hydrate dehydratase [Bacillus norwichensis]|uniref:Bifunctional NAD(P)H-hydrate repair enzyme n=1 Tax=Bacillus norwichensis TaxID=2762217 RepID=A0ABR8VJZ3_9BACI|nr:NAD(P)H-hydrate dehydratase [Bacillus norwichensis]MBD8005059.1 NAD(P)H-hydrate dehydratase [Bacillus norwichensis]
MFAAGKKDMQQMDQYTITRIGLPGVVLMENAGAKVVQEITNQLPSENPKIVVVAGSGNNGGDGFVIARRLYDEGYDCLLCLASDPKRIKGDAKIHFDVYLNRGLPIQYIHENPKKDLPEILERANIIVDAILGTGMSGLVMQPYDEIISMINTVAQEKMVIAVDVPSGLNSDSGKAEGPAINADQTITFVYPKKGFFLQDGPIHVGSWKAVDISVPPSSAKDIELSMPSVISKALVKSLVPKRPINGHKGTFGHVLVLGGSRQYVGAPLFTTKSALLSGTGLVTLAIPENIYPIAAAQVPVALFSPLSETDGHFSERSIHEITSKLQEFDVIAVGPGMSRFPEGEKWMETLFQSATGQTIVIDADALYLSRNHLQLLKSYKGDIVFTPHPGEMAGLLNMTVMEVEKERMEHAKRFAQKYGIHLLLKGHRSIIASPEGEIFINPAGHDALGKGGSGDVLTGLIASFIAQGAQSLDAMIAASYLHAKAGEEKAKEYSHYGVAAPDLIEGVREILNRLVYC